jgi:hypothetical protein
LPLTVLDVRLLVRHHEPVNRGAVGADGFGVFAHCREVVEVLLHSVGDRGLAWLRCRPLRDERCSRADAEFVLALALAVQSLVQVLAGRFVFEEELPFAPDPQAVVVALARTAGGCALSGARMVAPARRPVGMSMLTVLTLIGFILRRSILVRGEKTEYVTAKRNHTAKLFAFRNGGEGGIRTPGTSFSSYNGLASSRVPVPAVRKSTI